jgi:hypothetical protein
MDTTVDAPGADGDPSPGPRVAPTPRRRQNMSRGKPRMSHKEPCGSRRAWGDDDAGEGRVSRVALTLRAFCCVRTSVGALTASVNAAGAMVPSSMGHALSCGAPYRVDPFRTQRDGQDDDFGRSLEEPMGAFSWPRAPVRGRALTRSWRRSGRGGGRYPAYTMRGPYRDRPRDREASSRDRASRQNVRWNGESMEKVSDVESPTSSPARPDRCTPRTTSGARGPPP